MQRRFTERRVNANVEWRFVIGHCHENSTLFGIGFDGAFSETSLHKVPKIKMAPPPGPPMPIGNQVISQLV